MPFSLYFQLPYKMDVGVRAEAMLGVFSKEINFIRNFCYAKLGFALDRLQRGE